MNVCDLPQWQIFLSLVVSQLAYMGLEAWLGKTEKTKAGSVLELIWNAIKAVLKPRGN